MVTQPPQSESYDRGYDVGRSAAEQGDPALKHMGQLEAISTFSEQDQADFHRGLHHGEIEVFLDTLRGGLRLIFEMDCQRGSNVVATLFQVLDLATDMYFDDDEEEE